MASQNPRPLTAPEKAFWKDAFLACARSTLLKHDGVRMVPQDAAEICGSFADAAMDVYRQRSIVWRRHPPVHRD
jgi:hypothetical protein